MVEGERRRRQVRETASDEGEREGETTRRLDGRGVPRGHYALPSGGGVAWRRISAVSPSPSPPSPCLLDFRRSGESKWNGASSVTRGNVLKGASPGGGCQLARRLFMFAPAGSRVSEMRHGLARKARTTRITRTRMRKEQGRRQGITLHGGWKGTGEGSSFKSVWTAFAFQRRQLHTHARRLPPSPTCPACPLCTEYKLRSNYELVES